VLEAAAGALEDAAGALEAAGALDVAGGGVEVDGLDEHPAISAAAAAIVMPPAAMRARLSLVVRAAAFTASHESTSPAMCVAPLQSRTIHKSISARRPCGERTPLFPHVEITIKARYSLRRGMDRTC
jgi:hypothetical protein